MNLFADYQNRIFNSLKYLEKEKKIKVPTSLKNLTIELPPKNQNASIACNAALILAKSNNSTPIKLAEILKKNFLLNFKEFKTIEISGPGFLNIYFDIDFWERFLIKLIKSKTKYGSNKIRKKNIT